MNILAPVILAGAITGLLQLVDLDRPGQFSWEVPGSFGVPTPGAGDRSFGVPSPGSRDDIGVLFDMRGPAPVLADPRQQLLMPPLPAIGECFTMTATGVLASTVCGTTAGWPGLNGAIDNGVGYSPWVIPR